MLLIFVVCTLLDKIKIGLFNLAKVDKLAQIIEDFVKKCVTFSYGKIKEKLEKKREEV